MNGVHECGVDGHTQRVKDGILFCLFHWRRVSRFTQQRVYSTWRAYQAERTLETVRAYREATEQAKSEASATKVLS